VDIKLPERPVEHIVLFSGGVDSLITLRYAQSISREMMDCVTPVYCCLGHRYEAEEFRAVTDILHGRVNIDKSLSGLGLIEDSQANIPSRNGHLILAALRHSLEYFSGEVYIWLTVQKDELSIPDRSPEFLDRMSGACSVLSGRRVTVRTPWRGLDKTDMVRWYIERAYSEDDLRKTWACYWPSAGGDQCGNCPACIRRYIAFSLNGVHEGYLQDPRRSATAQMYIQKAKDGAYSKERCRRILEALDGE
jgi:7-cyano-7-deazaguanine synthase in queuosine biosynthesis